MIAVTYDHAHASISYIGAVTQCQFFQMYAPVRVYTNTIINSSHSHTQTLALYVEDRPLHLDM